MMKKQKKIYAVQYTIFVYEEDILDLEHTINDVLNKSSDLQYVVSLSRWS